MNKRIVLASKSPRRAEILRSVGWTFQAITAGVDESRLESEDAVSYVRRLAEAKADAVASRVTNSNLKDYLVLGADTVVVVAGEILGQPKDEEDARRMLSKLSGKWHEVLTGVALIRTDEPVRKLIDHETTRVRFASLNEKEISTYVLTGEPMDKAGAYAVQGRAALFIEEIQGDYFNIVGLPVRLVYELAKKLT